MRVISIILQVFFCSTLLMVLPANAAARLPIADKLLTFEEIEEAHFKKLGPNISGPLAADYERLFYVDARLPDLRKIRQSELNDLFKAAAKTTFYSADEKYARDMMRIFQQLERFGPPRKKTIAKMYDSLMLARMLTEAKNVFRKYPLDTIEAPPAFNTEGEIPEGSVTEWVVSQSGRTLTRRVVDMKKGAQVIILSHPSCQFSRNAHEAITADAELMKVMQPHTKWLVPQIPGFLFNPIQKWNEQYPNTALTIAYYRKEWPSMTEWSTPVFYFYKDGALVTSFIGWPTEGNINQLKKSLKMVGLE